MRTDMFYLSKAHFNVPRSVAIGLLRLKLDVSAIEALRIYKSRACQASFIAPEQQTEQDEEILRIAMLKMDKRDQKILVDVAFGDKRMDDIAEEIGMSLNVMRRRARIILCELEEYYAKAHGDIE